MTMDILVSISIIKGSQSSRTLRVLILKTKVEILQDFVAFSENINFNLKKLNYKMQVFLILQGIINHMTHIFEFWRQHHSFCHIILCKISDS